MKKTLAIVLALAMVLCMIPATFADTSKTISDKSYDLAVFSWDGANDDFGKSLGEETKANSVTAKYNYQEEKADETGKFTEDKKMSIVRVVGFDDIFKTATDIEVFIDGKKLEVNENASYHDITSEFNQSYSAVYFPAELTKAGYTDTYLITVKGKGTIGGETVNVTETAKVTVKFENNASYKNAKTATISKIESDNRELDAYIVGSKIYLDFVDNGKQLVDSLDITFKNENGSLFNTVTWASQTDFKDKPDDSTEGAAIYLDAEDKLEDSKFTYSVNGDKNVVEADKFKEVVFKLETSNAIYETKKYDIVVRTQVKESDPKGIYFAESTKTIRIGESYTPVVLGVATNKKVDAKLYIGYRLPEVEGGKPTDVNNDVLDIDDKTVIGTKEGVAFIYAEYTTNDGKTYVGSSAKITVTAGEVVDENESSTYRVTASSLNVRKGPGTSYAKAYSLSNGQTVKVDSIANGWAKLSDGNYVSAQYLVKVSAPTTGNGDTMYVTCRTLNVRKGPGTSYAKAGTLSRGNAVKVVNVTNGWAELDNGTYVSYKYLSK